MAMLQSILDSLYNALFFYRQHKFDARAHKPAWSTTRLGFKVVFFDPLWANTWYQNNVKDCAEVVQGHSIPTHPLSRLKHHHNSIWQKRLYDTPKKIAKAMTKNPSEELAQHALSFAFSTNNLDLLNIVANWSRHNPSPMV